jgi:hypothetical protein
MIATQLIRLSPHDIEGAQGLKHLRISQADLPWSLGSLAIGLAQKLGLTCGSVLKRPSVRLGVGNETRCAITYKAPSPGFRSLCRVGSYLRL